MTSENPFFYLVLCIIPMFLYGGPLFHTSAGGLERACSTLASRGECHSVIVLQPACHSNSSKKGTIPSQSRRSPVRLLFLDYLTFSSFLLDLNLEIGLETNDRV